MDVTHKTCNKCGECKPLKEFSPKKSGKYGRRAQCKECRRVPHLKKQREARQLCEERAQNGEAVKLCTQCEKCKPLSEFSANTRSSDGKKAYCKQCRSEYYHANAEEIAKRTQAYYVENSETIRAYRRAYYRENEQHENQRNRRYYQVNQTTIRKKNALYRKRNPAIKKASEQRRLARKRNLPDTFTAEDWQRALEYFDHRCAVCGREPDEHVTLAADHWIPLASPDCPGTIPENIVPLCHGLGGCNNEKQDLNPRTWLRRKLNSISMRKLNEIEGYFQSLQHQ